MSQIDELARKERLDYFKAWRAANPDKVKQHNQNYWLRRAEKKLTEQDTGGGEVHEVTDNQRRG